GVRIENEFLSDPEEVFGLLLFELAQRLDARMDEQIGRAQVAYGQALEEPEVALGNVFDRTSKIVLAESIALESCGAAVEEKRLAIVPGQAQKREHHVLMVALQEYALSSGLFLQTQGQIDDIASGRPPVDIVADEDDLVAGAGRYGLEDCTELIGASVDVADREQASGLGFRIDGHGS